MALVSREIPGTAVAVAVAGGVLIYAGFRGITPLQALRDIASGRPPAVAATNAGLDTATGTSTIATDAVPGAIGGALGFMLVNAAQRHAGEKYSQIRRWQDGYSDCSSFVGKALRDIGIAPPGMSLCVNYLAWSRLMRVSRAQLAAGDMCVTPTHMILATGNNSAIGQQNQRDNVRTGTPEQLIGNTFSCLRLKL